MSVHGLLDPTQLVRDFGYVGIFAMIFLETGVVVGFFLPGDSLLFTAGLLASQGTLSLPAVIVLAVAGAILGNNAGYWTGKKMGQTLFTRKDSFFFSHKRVTEAHNFFEKYGDPSLVLARFVPIVRTFLPIIAGVGEMRYKSFLTFNAIGGLLWGILVPVLGYTLGKTIPNIDKYILPAIFIIVILSLIPAAWTHYRSRQGQESP